MPLRSHPKCQDFSLAHMRKSSGRHARRRLQDALLVAAALEKMSLADRLRRYSFLKRYRGRWLQPDPNRGGPFRRQRRKLLSSSSSTVSEGASEEGEEEGEGDGDARRFRRHSRGLIGPDEISESSVDDDDDDDEKEEEEEEMDTRPPTFYQVPGKCVIVREHHRANASYEVAKAKSSTGDFTTVEVHFKNEQRVVRGRNQGETEGEVYHKPPVSAKILVILAVQNLTFKQSTNLEEVRRFLSDTFPYFRPRQKLLADLVEKATATTTNQLGKVSAEILERVAPALAELTAGNGGGGSRRRALRASMSRPQLLDAMVDACAPERKGGQEKEEGRRFRKPVVPLESLVAAAALMELGREEGTSAPVASVSFVAIRECLSAMFPFYRGSDDAEWASLSPGVMEVAETSALVRALAEMKMSEEGGGGGGSYWRSNALADEVAEAVLDTMSAVRCFKLLVREEDGGDCQVVHLDLRSPAVPSTSSGVLGTTTTSNLPLPDEKPRKKARSVPGLQAPPALRAPSVRDLLESIGAASSSPTPAKRFTGEQHSRGQEQSQGEPQREQQQQQQRQKQQEQQQQQQLKHQGRLRVVLQGQQQHRQQQQQVEGDSSSRLEQDDQERQVSEKEVQRREQQQLLQQQQQQPVNCHQDVRPQQLSQEPEQGLPQSQAISIASSSATGVASPLCHVPFGGESVPVYSPVVRIRRRKEVDKLQFVQVLGLRAVTAAEKAADSAPRGVEKGQPEEEEEVGICRGVEVDVVSVHNATTSQIPQGQPLQDGEIGSSGNVRRPKV